MAPGLSFKSYAVYNQGLIKFNEPLGENQGFKGFDFALSTNGKTQRKQAVGVERVLAINRARSLSERTGEPKSDIRPTPNGDCRRRGRGENISRVKLRGKEWGGRSPQAIENCGSESERRSLQRLPLAFDVFSAHVPEADFGGVRGSHRNKGVSQAGI